MNGVGTRLNEHGTGENVVLMGGNDDGYEGNYG